MMLLFNMFLSHAQALQENKAWKLSLGSYPLKVSEKELNQTLIKSQLKSMFIGKNFLQISGRSNLALSFLKFLRLQSGHWEHSLRSRLHTGIAFALGLIL